MLKLSTDDSVKKRLNRDCFNLDRTMLENFFQDKG